MSTEDEMDRSTKSYAYALEQVWEISRNLFESYQLDDPTALGTRIKAYSELTPEERLAASRTIGPMLGAASTFVVRIGQVSV